MKKLITSVLGVFAVLSLFAADDSKNGVTIEILVFSGRPNPTWSLQDTKPLEKLKPKLKDLPQAFDTEPAEWARLGFGGFRIRGGARFGLPDEIRVYRGVVKTGHGKAAKYLKDLTRLESSLIDESKKQPLEPAVRNAIVDYETAWRRP